MGSPTADFWGAWSSTANNNSPAGTDVVGSTLDDWLRAIQAGIRGALEPLSSVAGTNTITANAANITAYTSGQRFTFIPANSNTGASTLNITSLGAKNIFLNGAALVGYELRKNCPVHVHYDGTQFNILAGAHGGDGIPIATVMDRALTTVPNGFLECDGSAINRTTYADLFGAVGTTWGIGDGSTTFNLPPSAGRARIGKGTGTVAETVAAASVSTASDNFTVTSNNTKWITGQPVVLTTTGGLPAGLSLATTYFLIRPSATLIQFATTLANAQNGTAIDLTTQGTGSHTVTGTMTARTLGEQGGEETHAQSITEMLAHTHSITWPSSFYHANWNTINNDTGAGGTSGSFATPPPATNSRGGNVAMNNMQPFAVYMTIIKT